MQPGASGGPFALDGCRRNTEYDGSLFDGKPAKKAQFDNAALPRIESGELVERVIESHYIDFGLLGESDLGIETQPRSPGAALGGPAVSGVVNENVPHDLRGDAKKMSAIFPLRLLLLNEAKIGFVYERRTLKGMVGAFAAQMATGQTAQLAIHKRNQRFAGTFVSLAPIAEKLAYTRGRS